MIIESNYSQIQHNFEVFNSSYRSNQVYLSAKNQELSQYLGIDIFQSFIEQIKFLNLIWTKFNAILDDKKKMQLTLEEKVIEKNNILIQQQQALILDLQTENKNIKNSLEKVLRKIITKNTKLDISENLYMNKNFSKLNLNTNNLLSGNNYKNNNLNPLSNSKSQNSLLGTSNYSKSKSKSKNKTGNKNNLLLKEPKSQNAIKNGINGNNKSNNYNDLKGMNAINTSIDEAKGSNGEYYNHNANEKLNKMQFNLNKFIEKISTEGVINKANLISYPNNDNLNMSVNINHNYGQNNDLLNNSHFVNKSYNIDVDRELNYFLNESHSNIYNQNKDLINSPEKDNHKNSSKQKTYEKKNIQNTNYKNNNELKNFNGISSSQRIQGNLGGSLLKGTQSLANFNEIGAIVRKEKERDFSNTKGIKKDTGKILFNYYKS